VRLLLDEHYSPEIARQLRGRGHDAVAVAERADLVGLADDELLRRMARERRAIVTSNVMDFVPLATRVALEASEHYGLLLTSDRTMPRRLDAIGRLVDALDGFLRRHQGEDSYRSQVQWLSGLRGGAG
jgi:predicted nuclease of predicted toxin-antitoxin system